MARYMPPDKTLGLLQRNAMRTTQTYDRVELLALRDSPFSQVWPAELSGPHLDERSRDHERWHAKKKRLRTFLVNRWIGLLRGSRVFKGEGRREGVITTGPKLSIGMGGCLWQGQGIEQARLGNGEGLAKEGAGEGGEEDSVPIRTIQGRGRKGGSRGPYLSRGARSRCVQAITCSDPQDLSCTLGCEVPRGPGCRLMLCNARSVSQKAPLIYDLILEGGADLVGVTETWLGPEGGVPLVEMCPPGFLAFHRPRAQGRGGGVAVVIKEEFRPREVTVPQTAGCESLLVRWDLGGPRAVLIAYLAPCHATAALPELLDVIAAVAVEVPRLVVMGDFNLPSAGGASGEAREFLASMTALDLTQVIQGPTHTGETRLT